MRYQTADSLDRRSRFRRVFHNQAFHYATLGE
jgi:hypothetical protein